MEKVAVIMSTYNGERYIRKQLDTILLQEGIEPILFIRDDGSLDNTVKIIEEYCLLYPNIIFQNRSNIKNLGITESFLFLLKWVIYEYSDIEYFAFADQDDYWEKDKLFEAIQTKGKNPKWLYFSNKTVVDENLKILYKEHLVYFHDILEVFWGSQASGCTMVFSRMLAKEILTYKDNPHIINLLHDSLFYRVAHIIGSDIVFDERSFIKYRQHEKNVIGIEQSRKTSNNWKGLIHKSPHFISILATHLRDNYQEKLTPEGRYYLSLVCNYQHDFFCKWKLIIDKKALYRGPKLYCIWVGKLLLRRL